MEQRMKKLSVLLMVIAVLLSDWMCAVVAYNYCQIETWAEYGNSAPPSVAFVFAIPFLIGIVICVVSSVLLWKGIATKAVTVVLGIIVAIIGIAVVALTLLTMRAHSVSIIGGADGPTSIFLAGKVNPWSLIIGIVAGLMLLTAGIVLIRKRK